MKSLFRLTSAAVLCLFINACTDNCKKLVCENGGECFDGECNCPKWFSGENCQLLFNRNYEGEYAGKANSNGRSMAGTWKITADKEIPNRMYMPNGAYYDFITDSTLVIPEQTLKDENGQEAIISGGGKYSLNSLELRYFLEYSKGVLVEHNFLGEKKGFAHEG